jgi:hypothetical protein
MIRAGLLDASGLGVGHGSFRLGVGYDSAVGGIGELEARHRFAPWLYGFARGDISVDSRLRDARWRALLGIGGDW